MRKAYKALSILGTGKAATRGPAPLARRILRSKGQKASGGFLRKILKP